MKTYTCRACGTAMRVQDTRAHGSVVRRRRVCTNAKCRRRVWTFETEEAAYDNVHLAEARRLELLRGAQYIIKLLGDNDGPNTAATNE